MHEHIEALMTKLAETLRREGRTVARRRRGPRRARGTYVPALPQLPAMRAAH